MRLLHIHVCSALRTYMTSSDTMVDQATQHQTKHKNHSQRTAAVFQIKNHIDTDSKELSILSQRGLPTIRMTKLSFTVSSSYKCTFPDDTTANVLGAQTGVPIQSLLADEREFEALQDLIDKLFKEKHGSFDTLNLVFNAPNVPSGPDRSP